jgi:outer membrane protein OmpA-like peptidoglycan-associated protein
MKTITLLTASVAAIVAGCTDTQTGTLTNQVAFGEASYLSQSAQIRGGLPAALQNISSQFRAAVPTTINFEFNRADLDGQARAVLDQQAAWIKRYPNVQFSVYGHTDLVGSEGYNKSLGLRRARTALNYLVSRGVNKGQLRAVASRGETQPLIATPGPERQNRRSVTDVSGFANLKNSRGTGLDGKRALIVYNEYVTDEGSEIVTDEQQ